MRKFFKKLTLGCLLPLLLCEGASRLFWRDNSWFLGDEKPQEPAQKILFLGTSRTRYAIDDDYVAERASQALRRPVVVHQYAQGNGTSTMNFLGLRRALKLNPNYLRGTTVAIEACHNLPCRMRTWENGWDINQSVAAARLMRLSDLSRFWASDVPVDHKFKITTAFFSGSVYTAIRLNELAQETGGTFTNEVFRITRHLLFPHLPQQIAAVPLSAPGRAVQSENSIYQTRKFQEQTYLPTVANLIRQQKPFEDFDKLADRDLTKLIRDNGGTFFYFNLPQSQLDSALMLTDVGVRDGERFSKKVAEWGGSIENVNIAYDDSDFPDLLHMTNSKGSIYSKKFCDEILIPRLKFSSQRELGKQR